MKTPLSIACALALIGAAAPAASAAETVKLDLSSTANEMPTGAAAQSSPLDAGASYIVTVSGTGSLWSPAEEPAPVTCGAPEAAPIVEPSPGALVAVATVDAALIFAAPVGVSFWGSTACAGPNPSSPPAPSGFRMGTGGVLAAAVPIGGLPAAVNATHTYSYAVTGDGTPLQFQVADVRAGDNSGIFTIVIRTQAECAAVNCLGATGPPVKVVTELVTAPKATPTSTLSTHVPTAGGTGAGAGSPANPNQCLASSVLSVRLVNRKHAKFTKMAFWINGQRRGTAAGRKLYVSKKTGRLRVQKFRRLPDGKIVLKIMARTNRGKLVRVSATYYRCTPPNKKAKALPIK